MDMVRPFDLKIFITLFSAVFATVLGVGLVVPLLPVYASELGAGAFQIGLIFGAFSLSRSLFVPYFGRVSDSKGRKPFITLGLFLYFFLSISYLFATHVYALILVRLAQGFASAMILPVAQAYVGTITPKNREGLVMGLFNVALYGGLTIGPVLGGMVKDWLNIQASFMSMAGMTLLGFLLCYFLLPSERRTGQNRPSSSNPKGAYMGIVKAPPIWSLCLFRASYTTGIGIIWAFLPLMADTRFDLSSSSIGLIVMIGVLISGSLQAPMGILADRVNKKTLAACGGLLAGTAIFTMNFATGFTHLFLANALFGLAGGISFPAVMALGVIQGRRLDAMGSVMGLLTMAHSLGMLIGPIAAGLLLDRSSFQAIFMLGTAINVGGAVFFVLCYHGSRQ